MKVELIFLVALNFSYSQGLPNKRDNCMELIEKSGYSGQTHEVETEDGYILTVHRVLSNNNTVNNGPVFLMHGLLATAADFVITGPKIALAYLLSDNGYDVWMGNARGSKYSTAHRKHRIDSREFWNFSWHEIGFYDVPAMVDYVLNVTEASSTFYIGHSQGTTALIVMLSEHSEYNKKITQAHLMSPSAFETNLPHPMVRVFGQQIAEMIEDYRLLNFSPIFDVGNELSEVFCTESLGLTLCEAIIFAIVGNNRDKVEIDTRIIPSLTKHISNKLSAMQIIHYLQSMESGKFRQFDHRWKNMEFYNKTTPPDYELQNIKAPVYLYHGAQDLLISRLDVEHLRDLLSNVKKYRIIDNWNHIDFTYGRNARKVLYQDILDSFESDIF